MTDRRAPSSARRMVPAALLALAGLLAAAPRSARPSPAADKVRTVLIEGLRYRPRVIVVKRGEQVRWINEDPVPHTVTAVGGSFDSHSIAPGGSWVYVPERAGEYDYGCTFHPTMKGKLEVR